MKVLVSRLLGVRKSMECPNGKSDMKRVKKEAATGGPYHQACRPDALLREDHLVERSKYNMLHPQGKTAALLHEDSGIGFMRR